MILELIRGIIRLIRRIIFCQLLTYGNYCGVTRPIWPHPRRRYPVVSFCTICDEVPPVDKVDRVCLIHNIECLLARSPETGKVNWKKRMWADRNLLRRLSEINASSIMEHFYRLMCWGFYLVFFSVVHAGKVIGLVPVQVFKKNDLAKHKERLSKLRKLNIRALEQLN